MFKWRFALLPMFCSRYGKGLVIYWHGYVESLPDFSDDIVFTDRFVDRLQSFSHNVITNKIKLCMPDRGPHNLCMI